MAMSAEAVEYTESIYDYKLSDSDVPVILGFWWMRFTPLLPSLPGSLCPRVEAPDIVRRMGQIELNCVLILNWILWNRTVRMYENGFGIK